MPSPQHATIHPMTAALITLALITLATARVTRIIVNDKIAEPLRTAILNRNGHDGWWTYLAHCPWCMGWWIAAASAALAWWPGGLDHTLHTPWWVGYPATWAAIAYTTGWLLTKGEAH